MTRATGFLVGALLMLGVFLLLLSTVKSPTLVRDVVSSRAAADQVVTAPVDIEPVDIEPVDHTAASQVLPVAGTAGVEEEQPQDADGHGPVLDPQSWDQAVAAREADDHSNTTAVSRYRVWSPFRSEWAANGFARRLALATDVPVDVVNESPGNYQVVFSYQDDVERQSMIEHIEAITGLELE